LEICPILPFSCPDKNLLLLKLRAPKTDYFCRDSLRTQEYRAYFKEDETGYRQKEPFSASGFGSLMHKQKTGRIKLPAFLYLSEQKGSAELVALPHIF